MKLHDDQLVDNDNDNNTFDEQMFSMLFKGIMLILMIVMLILLVSPRGESLCAADHGPKTRQCPF